MASAMVSLEYEMTCAETIEDPLGPTIGSPLGERLQAFGARSAKAAPSSQVSGGA